MARQFRPEFVFFEMITSSGQSVVTSLAFPQVTAWGSSAQEVASKLAKAVQRQLIEEGHNLQAAQLLQASQLQRVDIDVHFPAGRQAVLAPALHAKHIAFVSTADSELGLGFVPALGIVALASPECLPQALQEAIEQEYRRMGRRTDARLQAAAQWYVDVEQSIEALDLKFYTPQELREIQESRTHSLLKAATDEVYGRRDGIAGLTVELDELRKASEGQFARSVVVVGSEGSGKTSLIERYAADRSARALQPVFETTAGRMLQALTAEGSWQAELTRLCKELADKQGLLFVGHLIELFEVGQYEGSALSLADALREPLARGRIRLVAEATPAEMALIERRSPGFVALLHQVHMSSLEDRALEQLVVDAVYALAKAHQVQVMSGVTAEILALHRRFSPYSGLPGKTIRFFASLLANAKSNVRQVGTFALGRDLAFQAFCTETGMPRHMLDPDADLDLGALEDFFRSRLFGQEHALKVVVEVLAAIKSGLVRGGRPIASLLFIGPTGVGKTETAKALTQFMFGSADSMIRIDMSEYSDAASVLRLTGDWGGGEGILIGAVRRQPFSVLLLDELEKAHASFFDLLLQILGEGRLTGADGQTANFCGCIVVMTSNLGAQAHMRHPMGVLTQTENVTQHFQKVVQQALRPELYNRIDHIVPFAALSANDRVPIFERELSLLRQREGVLTRAMRLTMDDSVLAHLVAASADSRYGARDVQRVLRQQLVLPLAQALCVHAPVRSVKVNLTVLSEPATAGVSDATPIQVNSEVAQQLVETAPLLVAETFSAARREWPKITQGPLYIKLQNRLARLAQDQVRHEKKRQKALHLPHWSDTAQAAEQRQLQALSNGAEDLFKEIVALENQALRAVLGEVAQAPSLASWAERMGAIKRKIFHAARAGSAVCSLGIYAAEPMLDSLLQAWIQLLKRLDCEHAVHVVWLEDAKAASKKTASERAGKSKASGAQAGTADDIEQATKSHYPYQRAPWPLSADKKIPRSALVVGYEIGCKAPAIFDLIRLEGGPWRHKQGDQKTDAFIKIANQNVSEFRTPQGVHRRHFFADTRPHRLLEDGALLNTTRTVLCTWPDAAQWKSRLDRDFDRLVSAMLQGNDERELLGEGA